MHSNYYRSTQRCTTQCARTCTAGPPQTTRGTGSDVNTPTPTPKSVPPLTSSWNGDPSICAVSVLHCQMDERRDLGRVGSAEIICFKWLWSFKVIYVFQTPCKAILLINFLQTRCSKLGWYKLRENKMYLKTSQKNELVNNFVWIKDFKWIHKNYRIYIWQSSTLYTSIK